MPWRFTKAQANLTRLDTDKTRVDLVSEKMTSHKVKNLEKARDFMIISMDTFNSKVVEIVFVRFHCICTCALVLINSWNSIRWFILIMCNVTSKYVCWFFWTFGCITQDDYLHHVWSTTQTYVLIFWCFCLYCCSARSRCNMCDEFLDIDSCS